MPATVQQRIESPTSIAEVAQGRLRASAYTSLRGLFCMYDEGMLVLRGRVPSFFHKQMALATVAGIPGVRQVVNQVEVVCKTE